MRKVHAIRLFVMIGICLMSSYIKSEPKSCSMNTARFTPIAMHPAVEQAGEEPVTYYGFYSKF